MLLESCVDFFERRVMSGSGRSASLFRSGFTSAPSSWRRRWRSVTVVERGNEEEKCNEGHQNYQFSYMTSFFSPSSPSSQRIWHSKGPFLHVNDSLSSLCTISCGIWPIGQKTKVLQFDWTTSYKSYIYRTIHIGPLKHQIRVLSGINRPWCWAKLKKRQNGEKTNYFFQTIFFLDKIFFSKRLWYSGVSMPYSL